jgi:beta-glucosidase
MCSYNQVNGEYASENSFLLTEVLRNEWGFQGFVVSDWGAVNRRVQALQAGLELEMPSSAGIGDAQIVEAVKKGELSEETLNVAVERLLTFIFKAVEHQKDNAAYDQEAHHQLARRMAQESMVLLKNSDHILPLQKKGKIAVIGEFAENPRYQGGGSSHVNPTKLDQILNELKAAAPEAQLQYAQGYALATDEADDMLIAQAKEAAANADVAILFVGLPDRYESEGYDRTHMSLPANHLAVIEEVAKVQSRVVVVLSNGSPVEMPWVDQVQAVLEGYLGGQAFGSAVADILFGDVNPSGKLAETFPVQLSDNPSYLNFPGEGDTVEYKEGIFVGYRYYDKKQLKPLFPFGYGLSYTEFEYSNLQVDKTNLMDQDTLQVRVDVRNCGERAGKEIVQLYVRDVESRVIRPDKELKGFQKIELQPGEQKTVSFTLEQRAFAYYNVELGDWHVESGSFEILVGKSSQDVVLKTTVEVESAVRLHTVIHRNTTIGDLMDHPATAERTKEMLSHFGMGEALKDNPEMMMAMMRYMPLRALIGFGQGKYTEEMLAGHIQQFNALLS